MTVMLEQTWRWFGPNDLVPLAHVRQAGATGVVSALHDVPCGEAWTEADIARRHREISSAGLVWSVVESVPVHEDIKQGLPTTEKYIENYCQSLRNLAACGVRTVCYNFMAVTDWTRTDLAWRMPDGSEALRFDATDAAVFDLHLLARAGAETEYSAAQLTAARKRWENMGPADAARLAKNILLGLPGTVDDLTVDQFRQRLAAYAHINPAQLHRHLTSFLQQVIPVAESCGVRLAIHPDDPPFPMFGLPRVAATEADFDKLFNAVPSPANGLTFCTGSLGAHPGNDLPKLVRKFGDRIHFFHLRNVKREPDGSFFEDDHLAGSTDMAAVMGEIVTLLDRRGTSLPMRPDHGHRMLDDLNKTGFYGGYSAIGRLRGLAELRGLEMGIRFARR